MRAKTPLLGLIFAFLCACKTKPELPVSSADAVQPLAPCTLVFSGDVMQHMPQITAARQQDGSYDYMECFQYIRPFWEQADFTIVNLETTLAQNGSRYSGYPMFASPKALATALKTSGVNAVALANNHCCDKGSTGIRTTIETLDSLSLPHTGVYADSVAAEKILMLSKGEYRIAILNYTYGTNGMPVPKGMVVNHLDTVLMAKHLEQAQRDSATHRVVFLHWGEEYRRQPDKTQKEVAAWCRTNGADWVIGSHPHVVQPVDTAQRIVYSLGNFISNQRNRYQDGGISVRLTFSVGEPFLEVLPHWVWMPLNRNGRSRAYYILPGYVSAEEAGLEEYDAKVFQRSLEDTRKIIGAVHEVDRK